MLCRCKQKLIFCARAKGIYCKFYKTYGNGPANRSEQYITCGRNTDGNVPVSWLPNIPVDDLTDCRRRTFSSTCV